MTLLMVLPSPFCCLKGLLLCNISGAQWVAAMSGGMPQLYSQGIKCVIKVSDFTYLSNFIVQMFTIPSICGVLSDK